MQPTAAPAAASASAAAAAAAHPGLSLDVPVELIKDPCSWTVEDISVWLHWLGIGEHAEAFGKRGVDGRVLLQLSAEGAWADLGVVDPAQQRVLDSAVEPLRHFRDAEGVETGLALHAVEGPVQGEVFFIGASGITGGRHSASNGVVLSENYVSRRHFQITRDRAGQHLLQDVGSTTGTFLMVREELPLEHLMILQLGTTELTVQVEGDCCTLVATEGPDKDARAIVPPEGLFIGREASNGLCIRDPQISAFHCEVRPSPDGGFVLDDKYSTNRTWLRLAPDGQPSKRYVLNVGDLFKVGSTLFHVVEPAAAAAGDAPSGDAVSSAAVPTPGPGTPLAASWGAVPGRRTSRSAGEVDAESDLADDGLVYPAAAEGPPAGSDAGADALLAAGPQLRWEPLLEGDVRPFHTPEEYARLLKASRRRMQASYAEASARRSLASAGGGLHMGQDAGLRERELSSLQQRMRNSRAQTAYSLQQQRPAERRDEDLCKICYDRDIEVVLYPCGHFVLCRWCAQKVSDCPVCRFVITDVIRTYKA